MDAVDIRVSTDAIVKLYQDVENELVRNVASRFSITDAVDATSSDKWRLEKLEQLGGLNAENVRIISRITGRSSTEISTLLRQAGYSVLDADERIYKMAKGYGLLNDVPVPVRSSTMIQSILLGSINNTEYFMNTMCTTASEFTSKAYRDIVNRVYLESSLGINSYQTSVRNAVKDFASKGISGVTYTLPDGRTINTPIDVAARRCVLTAKAQTVGKMQEARAKEWGTNLVEVSSHNGARPDHAVWQGKVFCLEGSTPEYENLREVTKYGTVTGLCGANCKHRFRPFFEGLSERVHEPFSGEENDKAYEDSQVQRKLERDIRGAKREVIAADSMGDAEAMRKAQEKLAAKKRELKDHLDATGRYDRTDRQQVLGFDRRLASDARKAKPGIKVPDPVKTTGVVGKSDRSSELFKKLGEDHYNGILDRVNSSDSDNARLMWNRFQGDVRVADVNWTRTQQALDDKIYINRARNETASRVHTPYETTMHETGHAMDYLARRAETGQAWSTVRYYSHSFENGIFPYTIKDEVTRLVLDIESELKDGLKKHATDIVWLHEHHFLDDFQYGYYSRHGMYGFKTPSYARVHAYKELQRRLMAEHPTTLDIGPLSDILEGATGGKISCGVGHGKSYWQQSSDLLPTEAFANMLGALTCNPGALAVIRRHLPRSYSVFERIMGEMSRLK